MTSQWPLSLTGVFRFRSGLFGRQVLQVEETLTRYTQGDWRTCEGPEPYSYTVWRDATSMDLAHLIQTGSLTMTKKSERTQ